MSQAVRKLVPGEVIIGFIRPDGTQALFLWTRRTAAVVRVRVPGSVSRATEYAIAGTPAREHELVGATLHGIELEPGDVRLFDLAP